MSCARVHKADPNPGQSVPSVLLRIDKDFPPLVHGTDWRGESVALFERDAEIVLRALNCLPGGTKSRLLVRLLEEAANLYRVPLLEPESEPLRVSENETTRCSS